MKRNVHKDLTAWKNSPAKKPLVLRGARQVGKTWSLKNFGEAEYAGKGFKYHYIDFRENAQVHSIFDETYNPAKIIELLEFGLGINVDTRNDLVIFDEIQECPRAVTSFKYFAQDMPELDIIGAGSHLGLLRNEESFPVGKADFLHMFPMTYCEFVREADPQGAKALAEYNMTGPLPQIVHEKLLELLMSYIFTGGMPEIVSHYVNSSSKNINRLLEEVRNIQSNLVEGYRSDFTKYSGLMNAAHINHVFESIPRQLAAAHDTEVSKYTFKDVIPRRKGFENIRGPLEWLKKAGLCIKSNIAKDIGHPLLSYCDENKFKLYLFDVGLLNCMLATPPQAIMDKSMGPFKGFIVENFAAQEMYAHANSDLISWKAKNAEIEFLLTKGADIIPLEVKSANRSRRAKSLDAYIQRYAPKKAYKISAQNYGKNQTRGFETIPLYACSKLFE